MLSSMAFVIDNATAIVALTLCAALLYLLSSTKFSWPLRQLSRLQHWGSRDLTTISAPSLPPHVPRGAQGPLECSQGHTVQFYEDDIFLCRSISRFMAEGLSQGEGVIVIALLQHIEAMEKLVSVVLDVERYKKRGQLRMLDATEYLARIVRQGERLPDADLFGTTLGEILDEVSTVFPVLRIYGEFVSLLVAQGNLEGALALDRMLNTLQRSRSFRMHCGFTLSDYTACAPLKAFDAICKEHLHRAPAEPEDALTCTCDQNHHIALLQQKALKLEGEIIERRAIEAALRRREAELVRANEEAKAANKAKSAFLANVSHEIRTPLAAIVGFTELLMHPNSAEESLEAVRIINRQGKELTRLLSDILDLSKIESGCLETEVINFTLDELLSDVKVLLSPLASEKGIELAVNDKTASQIIRSDPARLRQVLMNVIGNAIKFTSHGGVYATIELMTPESEKEPPMLQCRVKDTGCGIAPKQAKVLFQPFSQGDNTISRRYGGTGLGLCLSRQLCRMMGGDLVLESSLPEVGSTFLITVDAGSREVRQFAPKPVAPEEGPLQPVKSEEHSRMAILVVDDNDVNRLLMLRVLARMGYQDVTTASDGLCGLGLVKQRHFNIVFMDIQMPRMNGLEACRLLRELYENRPRKEQPVVIAFTADAMRGDQERCEDAGFDDYISKPVNFSHLRDKLSQWGSVVLQHHDESPETSL